MRACRHSTLLGSLEGLNLDSSFVKQIFYASFEGVAQILGLNPSLGLINFFLILNRLHFGDQFLNAALFKEIRLAAWIEMSNTAE